MTHFDYRLRVSIFNRNSNRNEVVMVATESQTIFKRSMAISKEVIMDYDL